MALIVCSCMGLVVFTDCPTSDGDDFLSELMTQHILDQAMGTASPPPLSHSHLHQVHNSHTHTFTRCTTLTFIIRYPAQSPGTCECMCAPGDSSVGMGVVGSMPWSFSLSPAALCSVRSGGVSLSILPAAASLILPG